MYICGVGFVTVSDRMSATRGCGDTAESPRMEEEEEEELEAEVVEARERAKNGRRREEDLRDS